MVTSWTDINAKFDGLQNNKIKKRKAYGHVECA